MSELKYLSKPEFTDLFIKVTEGLSKETIATLVWELLNETWTDGHNFGKDNGGYDD